MKISSLQKQVTKKRNRRLKRVRRPILEKRDSLRLSVFRSGKHIYAQIIDDKAGKTLVACSDLKLKQKLTKTQRAEAVGKELGQKAKSKKINKIVFDRGWYQFHGRVKALAQSAREHGLKF